MLHEITPFMIDDRVVGFVLRRSIILGGMSLVHPNCNVICEKGLLGITKGYKIAMAPNQEDIFTF